MAAPVQGPASVGDVYKSAPVVLAGLNDDGEVTPFRTNGSGELVFSTVPDAGAAGGDLTGTYPDPTIGVGKVTSAKILDGTIVSADINASAAIPASKLSLTVRHAAGVPTGAPATTELPIAFDSTAVSGGLYYWSGAAWVKVSTIP